jgi:mannose-6-phosphate isomerase-like protein (cupin superfamily)
MILGSVDRVDKPWGYEFRAALGPSITLTYLTIYPESQTSLHCHPRKTTSLTAIAGKGEIKFLNDSIAFTAGTSFMVRNGLFHQISNASAENLVVLEFENPSDALDLVRLEDAYGRSFTSYEEKSDLNYLNESEKDFFSRISQGGIWSNQETDIMVIEPDRHTVTFESEVVYAVLEGGLRDRFSNSLILREGDCTTAPTINRLVRQFKWDPNTKLLQIKKRTNK